MDMGTILDMRMNAMNIGRKSRFGMDKIVLTNNVMICTQEWRVDRELRG